MSTTTEPTIYLWKATRNTWTRISEEKYARLRAIGEQVRKATPHEARNLTRTQQQPIHQNDSGLYEDL